MGGALSGLRIVDFSRVLAGPFATMLLADLGAAVTKIERPGVGDDTRHWGPPYDDLGQATYFQSINRNKSSLALDLGDPGSLARARELALGADVVVENFRPDVMPKLGLGSAELRAANPRLVYCSITGFGGTGEGARMPGYDLLIQALGGLMSVTGEAGGGPLKVGVALVDVLCGILAATGILAAIEAREAGGAGRAVEVDLLSSLLWAMGPDGDSAAAAEAPGRLGNAEPGFAPCEVLAAADGPLVIAIGDDEQFARLCRALGLPGLAFDRRFGRNAERLEHRGELRAVLERALAGAPAADWAAALRRRDVPAGAVADLASAFAAAADLGLDPIVELARERGEPLRLTRNPIAMSATPPTYRSPPPDLPQA